MAATRKDTSDLPAVPVHILIVDDDEPHAQAVAESLERVGYECVIANSGERGVQLIESQEFDVVITDLKMDDVDGLGILQKTKEELPDAEVILLTGHFSYQSALAAGQAGASMYLTKPVDISELRQAVERASTRIRLLRKNAELSRRLDERFGFEGVIGNSPAMKRVIDRLRQVAPTGASVLILGESGTGKELVARALHQNSDRKNKPFVPLNISALPESILESELFGHEPGSFTGAVDRRIGKFEYANGGTLFLDEVGEMPLQIQAKFLRVLEGHSFERVGGHTPVEVDVRVVAATNRDLEQAVREGEFRRDLFFRLNILEIEVPPLRDRRDDIEQLIPHFLGRSSSRIGEKGTRKFSPEALDLLMQYDWPGNVRELRNAIERASAIAREDVIGVDDIRFSSLDGDAPQPVAEREFKPLSMKEIEKRHIQATMSFARWVKREAARLLGIERSTLDRKLKTYGIERPEE